MHSIPGRRFILSLFLIFLLLPIYWLVNMSFKTNSEIVSTMTLWPHEPTLQHYRRIFTDESWYSGYINSLKYVIINTFISISVALPAAYGFSRFRIAGARAVAGARLVPLATSGAAAIAKEMPARAAVVCRRIMKAPVKMNLRGY